MQYYFANKLLDFVVLRAMYVLSRNLWDEVDDHLTLTWIDEEV